MLELVAAIVDRRVALWVRRSDGAPVDDPHQVGYALDAVGIDAGSDLTELVAWLPDADRAELEPHTVSACFVPDGLVVSTLAAAARHNTCTRAGGVRIGAAVIALAAIVREAAALVVRQEVLPSIVAEPGAGPVARWTSAPADNTSTRITALAAALPHAVFALTSGVDARRDQPHLPTASRVALDLIDVVVDELVRAAGGDDSERAVTSAHGAWLDALDDRTDPQVRLEQAALDSLAEEVERWQRPLRRRMQSPWRLTVRLEPPPAHLDHGPDDPAGPPPWYLRFGVRAADEQAVRFDATDAWAPDAATRRMLQRGAFDIGHHLLLPLAEAARTCGPIADALQEARPCGIEITTAAAYEFLAGTSRVLHQQGIDVEVPGWWSPSHRPRRVGLRATVRGGFQGGRRSLDALNLEALVDWQWQAAVGDITLSARELAELAASTSPLVRLRGQWTLLDQHDLHRALRMLGRTTHPPDVGTQPDDGQDAALDLEPGLARGTLTDLVRLATGAARVEGLRVVGVDADGDEQIDALLTSLTRCDPPLPYRHPPSLRADLRSYQERGAAWLGWMSRLGLGALLADDMGLGKTVQALASVAEAWDASGDDGRGPTLVVCPTSVVTNWTQECARFVPDLPVLVHHGPGRLRGDQLANAACGSAVVITSYAVLARDAALLVAIDWRAVVLDEAQNIRNPSTRAAVAAGALRARARIALTGTPVENHVGDLWSIMHFLVPGLLGSRTDFRRRYLLPVQTGALPDVAEQLRAIVAPFVLRREKRDLDIVPDLPDQLVRTEWCRLTAEQAGLYEGIVRDAQRLLASRRAPTGIDRRGTIISTITKLKQACNHPAHLLADGSTFAGRSGKVHRLEAIIEQVLEAGDRALVFTRFTAFGELLRPHLESMFDIEVPFLHGGTSRSARDEMVARFQRARSGDPPVFLLSLKAGGSGLNLTAANHVVHVDRWWNPASEQQASDRAWRIGQLRDVTVHTLVCEGTVEQRIDEMLRQKHAVARQVVRPGERWITDMDDDELFDLLQLREDTLLQTGELDDIRMRRPWGAVG